VIDPVRRCAGCGRKAGKSGLVRVIRLPDGAVMFDPDRKLEGRSLYFCRDLKCFEKLMKRRAPEKLLKNKLPDDMRDAIERYLSCTESVS
jgi:predicted RNA-binding protein YlxR (DUF448 family)